jgi:hypothetical protein
LSFSVGKKKEIFETRKNQEKGEREKGRKGEK